MTATVRLGQRGVDFSFAKPPADRLLELGYSFIVGYISVPPSAPAKNITKEQCDAYIAAGLKVLLVWEMSATRASLGASYGTLDGTSAKREALARGYPIDVPILAADDTNTIAANIDKQEAYMRAFAIACAPYPIGIYGDTDILSRCSGLWQIGWLPNAWSWSGASRADAEAKARALGAHVLQAKGFYVDDTWAVDPNTVIAGFPAWGWPDPVPPPVPPPTPSEDRLVIRLFAPSDSPARFFAQCTDAGGAITIRWTGPGDDPKVAARIAAHRAAHDRDNPTIPFERTDLILADLINCDLDLNGPYPAGLDPELFANTEQIKASMVGNTVDQVARDDALHANEAVTRIAATISDIRMGGQRIADAGGH